MERRPEHSHTPAPHDGGGGPDTLVVLAGTSPTPALLAALTFTPRRLVLVHTADTARRAARIVATARRLCPRIEVARRFDIGDDAFDFHAVGARFTALAADLQRDWRLCYTGGTKVMSTHAVLRHVERFPDRHRWRSYLDATSETLRFTDGSFHPGGIDSGALTVDALAAVHGVDLRPGDQAAAQEAWLRRGRAADLGSGDMAEARVLALFRRRLAGVPGAEVLGNRVMPDPRAPHASIGDFDLIVRYRHRVLCVEVKRDPSHILDAAGWTLTKAQRAFGGAARVLFVHEGGKGDCSVEHLAAYDPELSGAPLHVRSLGELARDFPSAQHVIDGFFPAAPPRPAAPAPPDPAALHLPPPAAPPPASCPAAPGPARPAGPGGDTAAPSAAEPTGGGRPARGPAAADPAPRASAVTARVAARPASARDRTPAHGLPSLSRPARCAPVPDRPAPDRPQRPPTAPPAAPAPCADTPPPSPRAPAAGPERGAAPASGDPADTAPPGDGPAPAPRPLLIMGLGGSRLSVLAAVRACLPARAVLLFTRQSEKELSALDSAVRRALFAAEDPDSFRSVNRRRLAARLRRDGYPDRVKFAEAAVDSADVADVAARARAKIDQYRPARAPVVADITTGTKAMSIGLALAAHERGGCITYVSPLTREVYCRTHGPVGRHSPAAVEWRLLLRGYRFLSGTLAEAIAPDIAARQVDAPLIDAAAAEVRALAAGHEVAAWVDETVTAGAPPLPQYSAPQRPTVVLTVADRALGLSAPRRTRLRYFTSGGAHQEQDVGAGGWAHDVFASAALLNVRCGTAGTTLALHRPGDGDPRRALDLIDWFSWWRGTGHDADDTAPPADRITGHEDTRRPRVVSADPGTPRLRAALAAHLSALRL